MFPFVVFWFFLVFPTSQHCSLLSPLLLPSTITEQKAAREAGTVPTCFFPSFSKVPWTSLFLHRDHGHTPAVEVSLQMHCKGTDTFVLFHTEASSRWRNLCKISCHQGMELGGKDSVRQGWCVVLWLRIQLGSGVSSRHQLKYWSSGPECLGLRNWAAGVLWTVEAFELVP